MAESTDSSETATPPEFTFSHAPSLEDMLAGLPSSLRLLFIVLCVSSRVMQSRFAAERDWEQFHTPRNLLLALVSRPACASCCEEFCVQVGEVGELSEIL